MSIAFSTFSPGLSAIDDSWAYGLVSSVNGMIYATPFNEDKVLKIDPVARTAEKVGPDFGVTSGRGKWVGLVEAENGKLYGVPEDRQEVLVFDPKTEDATTFSAAAKGFYGGALADNGKIYCPPIFNTTILKINPSDNTSETVGSGLGSASTGSDRWGWFIKAGNGKLYGAPRAENDVLVIDPSDDSISLIPTGLTGGRKFVEGVLASTGEIWFVPRDAETFLVVDTANDTARTVGSLPSGTDKWNGVALLASGNIFMQPRQRATYLIINPQTDEFSETDVPELASNINNFVGSASRFGREIFSIPFARQDVGLFVADIPLGAEEIFNATYATASAAAPKRTALVRPLDVQRSIDTDVSWLAGNPKEWTLDVIIPVGELQHYRPGNVFFVRADVPGLRQGRKVLLKGFSARDIRPTEPVTCVFTGPSETT